MATTPALLWDRLNSLCAGLGLIQAQTPFDFDQQATGMVDGAYRVALDGANPIGGFAFSETRNDTVSIWIARKLHATPQAAYRALETDVTSVTAALIHDGCGAGDYAIPDGVTSRMDHETGREFAVAQLLVPINYEVAW